METQLRKLINEAQKEGWTPLGWRFKGAGSELAQGAFYGVRVIEDQRPDFLEREVVGLVAGHPGRGIVEFKFSGGAIEKA